MWNDRETDVDLLGHNKLSETIISIMNEQDLRPLTIGVYGQWGVGKSSVLSLINAKFVDDEDTLCLTFNGWLFQGYEDTRSALMESVVSELMKKQPKDQKVLRLGKKLLKRIKWLKVAKLGGSLTLTALTGLPATALLGIPGFLKDAKDFFSPKEEPGETKVTVEKDSDDSFLKEAEDTVPGQINAFRKELKELIETSKVSRVVVLVDELDRCLPTSVIDILEAIRLFLFVEGTVFVLAADEQMIEYAVRKHYPDLPLSQADYTKHYLEKLVQIPIRVPSLNQFQTKNYIKLLLLQYELQSKKEKFTEILTALESSRTNPYENVDISAEFISSQLPGRDTQIQRSIMIAEQLGAILANELRGNPRNIKRFLNTIFLRLRVAIIYKIPDKVKLDALAKLLLLERFHDNEWGTIVNEVTSSSDGRSDLVKKLESIGSAGDANSAISSQKRTPEIQKELSDWGRLQPSLKDVDLRPYLFVSREKAVGFTSSDDMPHVLVPIYEVLVSGATVSMAAKEEDIKALNEEQASILHKYLVKASHTSSNWDTIPDALKGVQYLMKRLPTLEEAFVKIFDPIASKDIKTWMISNLGGMQTEKGKAAKKALLDRIVANTDTPSGIKKLAQQMYSK